jgi:uncharacterized protein YciI
MIFAFHFLDHLAVSETIRAAKRPEHQAYLGLQADRIAFAGPLREASGKIIGSLLVLDFDDQDAALDWLAMEPFNQAGLYAAVSVQQFENRWSQRVGYPPA